MTEATVILITLIAYKVMMILIGLWAASRNRSEADFFLGGRGLGPFVAGLSYAASTSSAWVILGFSGFVYAVGLSALWMVPGILGAYAVVWLYFGRRVREESIEHQQVTLTDFLVQDGRGDWKRVAAVAAGALVFFCFVFYVAAQLDAAGNALTEHFAVNTTSAIIIGAVIVVFYSLVGGFWAVSVTDTVQAAIMMVVSVGVPVAALVAAGGPVEVGPRSRLSAGAARSTALREVDLVFLMGARLNWIMHYGLPPRFNKDVRIIQLDIEPEEIGANVPAEVALVGDGKAVVGQLNRALDNRQWFYPSETPWRAVLQEKAQANMEAVQPASPVSTEPRPFFVRTRARTSLAPTISSQCNLSVKHPTRSRIPAVTQIGSPPGSPGASCRCAPGRGKADRRLW